MRQKIKDLEEKSGKEKNKEVEKKGREGGGTG